MEVSGAVSRRIPGFFHRESDSFSSGVSMSYGTRNLRVVGHRNSNALPTLGMKFRDMNNGFCDDGHLEYYYVGPRCHGKFKKEKEDLKKELKLLKLKGLSGDQFQRTPISVQERTESLVRQLQQLRAEEKELKRKRKLEKAKLKMAHKRTTVDSSSSSSDSSESEGGDVINMSYHRRKALSQAIVDGWKTNRVQESTMMAHTSPQTEQCCLAKQNSNLHYYLQNGSIVLNTKEALSQVVVDGWQINTLQESALVLPSPQTEQCRSIERNSKSQLDVHEKGARNGSCVQNESSSAAAYGKRVEVCMGNKCRKAGAAMLLEEFERVVGVDGGVCGCKCMGKCRDGPNVRVKNSFDDASATNPLCIGVGLEDVDRIVANFLNQKDSSLVTAT